MAKGLDWQDRNRIMLQACEEHWLPWARRVGTLDRDAVDRTDQDLCRVLGIPVIRGGLLSPGWVIKQMDVNLAGPRVAPLAAVFVAMSSRESAMSSVGWLQASLVSHRELGRHGAYLRTYSSGQAELDLFSRDWGTVHQVVLEWCLARGPLDIVAASTAKMRGPLLRCELDDRMRPHCTDGPAVVGYADDVRRQVYALHGVQLTADQWLMRGNAQAINGVTNAEVKRVLVEDMGIRRFLDDMRMRPFHTDRFGTLYRLEDETVRGSNSPRHLCWVHVSCPSTGQDYMLAVPPNTRTAHEGVAWTFGKVPEDYQPVKET